MKNQNQPPQLTDSTRRSLYELAASMDNGYISLEDKNPSGTGFAINVSEYYPALAIIFKTMLLVAIDGYTQNLTIEFDNSTATTSLTIPNVWNNNNTKNNKNEKG